MQHIVPTFKICYTVLFVQFPFPFNKNPKIDVFISLNMICSEELDIIHVVAKKCFF